MSAELLNVSLVSNGHTLSSAPDRLGRLVASDPTRPIEELREQYRAQGYIWLKGLIERDVVLAFRHRFFSALQETGLLAKGSDPVDGIYSGGGEDGKRAHTIWMEAVRWPEYAEFCMTPALLKFYQLFLEGELHLHKRKLIRYTKPGDPHCTGGHYDLIYLRGGTDELTSCWIPIGDTPVEMGGLIYLEGSDALGRKMEAEFSRLNAHLPPEERVSAYNRNMKNGWLSVDLPALAEKANGRWLIADYEAGDAVIHSPYMIHAATINNDAQKRIRLSTDIRYQRNDLPIDQRWNNDYYEGDNL